VQLTYLIPVHNEEATLEASIERLVARMAVQPNAAIFLIENGSRDRSWEVCERLAGSAQGVVVAAFREPVAGLGHALHRGLVEALDGGGPLAERWVVMTAADLPFGFTDLDAALPAMARAGGPRLIVGSKAHPESARDGADWRRAVVSQTYRGLRRVLAGMQTADSQGSLLLRLDLGRELVGRIQSRDFFFSTEVVFLAERMGETVLEVPVVREPQRRATTVRFLRDATAMFGQLAALTRREGRIRRQR
jgi:dolichyl-phosphate beta-glucosyltransferase